MKFIISRLCEKIFRLCVILTVVISNRKVLNNKVETLSRFKTHEDGVVLTLKRPYSGNRGSTINCARETKVPIRAEVINIISVNNLKNLLNIGSSKIVVFIFPYDYLCDENVSLYSAYYIIFQTKNVLRVYGVTLLLHL